MANAPSEPITSKYFLSYNANRVFESWNAARRASFAQVLFPIKDVWGLHGTNTNKQMMQ